MVASGRHLAISVSREQLDRTLRVFQGLLAAFEARGWRVELTGHAYYDERIREYIQPDGKLGATRVRVNDEWVYLRLSEKQRFVLELQKPPPGVRGRVLAKWRELHPPHRVSRVSGVLELVAEGEGSRKSFKDGERERIEAKLAELPQELRWMAARAKQYREEVDGTLQLHGLQRGWPHPSGVLS